MKQFCSYRFASVHDKKILLVGKWYKTKEDSLFPDINEITVDHLLGECEHHLGI